MATYYVRQSGGSDGNTGLSFALGWATIQYAVDNASVAGDIVIIASDGVYLPTATIDFDTNAGSRVNPINFIGANSIGVIDGSVATVRGTSLPASSNLVNYNLTSLSIKMTNIRLTEATLNNISVGVACNGALLIHKNVRIDTADADGVYHQESDADTVCQWHNCEIDSNGDKGCESIGVGRGGHKLFNCAIHDNGGVGWEDAATVAKSIYLGNQFYDNGDDGLQFLYEAEQTAIVSNIFFGNGGDGLSIPADEFGVICINNIFRSNGGYGINTNTGAISQFAQADYNCFSNNTSGHIDINSGTPPGDNNVIDDPDFTSEVDGSEDFTLKTGSPCIDVGYGYNG